MVRRLTVTAQLQTPSQRHVMPSALDKALGQDIHPNTAVDAIVFRALEEAGQHILRVEVGYQTTEGTQKTLRKFYRFNVTAPISVNHKTVRLGDTVCIVSVAVENVSTQAMVLSDVSFRPNDGLMASRIGGNDGDDPSNEEKSATALLDSADRLEPGSSVRYMFRVEPVASNDPSLSPASAPSTGIAGGDALGRAVLGWRKTLGESGQMSSSIITCPSLHPPLADSNGNASPAKVMMGTGSQYVVHGSGLSVDVAALAAQRAAGKAPPNGSNLDQLLPVTVEAIDPPSSMSLATPQQVRFLVVNHSPHERTLQLQFRLNHMSGVAVCGKSFRTLGEIPGSGGSVLVAVKLLPLVAGLLRVQGCCVVDLQNGQEIPQPPLFHLLVGPEVGQQ